MDGYRIPLDELPPNLYWVHYPESQTTLTHKGLNAANQTRFYGDSRGERDAFVLAVENHFTWSYRGNSPFISLFPNRDHAEKWGRKEPWRGSDPPSEEWKLCTIDTSLLTGIYIFKLSELVDGLGVRIPDKAQQHREGAYICLHRIPAHAIVEEQDASYFNIIRWYDDDPSCVTSDELIKELERMGI